MTPQSKTDLYQLSKGFIGLLILIIGYLIKEEISDTKNALQEFNSNIKETTIELKETRVQVSNHDVQLSDIKLEQKDQNTKIGLNSQSSQVNSLNILTNTKDIEILKDR
jgi:hypothetical protein